MSSEYSNKREDGKYRYKEYIYFALKADTSSQACIAKCSVLTKYYFEDDKICLS